MSIKFVKAAAIAMAGTLALSAGSALAQEAKSLDELLQFVKQGQVQEQKENRAREQRFAKDKANQAAELKRAEAERTRQEQISAQLEDQFEENELLVAAKQAQLKEKLGYAGGTVRPPDFHVWRPGQQPGDVADQRAVSWSRGVPAGADRENERFRYTAQHRGNRARMVRTQSRDG